MAVEIVGVDHLDPSPPKEAGKLLLNVNDVPSNLITTTFSHSNNSNVE
jgi:hypothetical protein